MEGGKQAGVDEGDVAVLRDLDVAKISVGGGGIRKQEYLEAKSTKYIIKNAEIRGIRFSKIGRIYWTRTHQVE